MLKSGKEVTREEEKSDWPEDSNDDVPSTPSSASGDQTPAKKKKKALDKRSTRTDYQKNKPYTTAPIYHMLHEYFTLPEGGKVHTMLSWLACSHPFFTSFISIPKRNVP